MSSRYDERRQERIARRLEELRAWRNAREHPDRGLVVRRRRRRAASAHPWRLLAGGRRRRSSSRPAVPCRMPGPASRSSWSSGSAARASCGSRPGFRPGSIRSITASPSPRRRAGGERITIEAEVVPKGMFGSHVAEPRLERAHFVVPHHRGAGARARSDHDRPGRPGAGRPRGRAASAGLSSRRPSRSTVRPGRRPRTRRCRGSRSATSTRSAAAWTRSRPATRSRRTTSTPSRCRSGICHQLRGRWNRCRPRRSTAVRTRPRRGGAAAASGCEQDYPPVGRLALTGHAHIDLAWLWPVAETRRKGRRTFATVLDLMERYPDFTFNQSSAQLYAWIEEDAPDLFARVKERVAEGRWEPIGGSWVEPDCQVTGGEVVRPPAPLRAARLRSLVRQALDGRLAAGRLRVLRRHPAAPARRRDRRLLHHQAQLERGEPLPLRPLHLGRDRRQPGDGQHVPQSVAGPRLQRQHRPARHPRHLAQLRRQAPPPGEPARLRLG